MINCDGNSTLSDKQTNKHTLGLNRLKNMRSFSNEITNYSMRFEKSVICGVQYSFKMKISSDSIKSAGEILLTVGDEIIILTGYI